MSILSNELVPLGDITDIKSFRVVVIDVTKSTLISFEIF
jgi:hypothetical protein